MQLEYSPKPAQHKRTRVTSMFLVMALLPLFLIAVGGSVYYLHLLKLSDNDGVLHAKNAAEIIAGQTDAFINQYSKSARLLAGEQEVKALIRNQSDLNKQLATKDLKRYCDELSAAICYLMDLDGFAIADQQPLGSSSIVGNNYGFRTYFKSALQGNDEIFPALGVTTKKRGIYFSSPVYSNDNIAGAAVLKISPNLIEKSFANKTGLVALLDPHGVVFAASNPEWLFKTLTELDSITAEKIKRSRQFGDTVPESLSFQQEQENKLIDAEKNYYFSYKAPVHSLPGWTITYLYRGDQTPNTIRGVNRQFVGISFALLFLCTSIASALLFRRLKAEVIEREGYQDALEHSEDRLRRFAQLTEEAIFIHDKGQAIDANLKAEEMFGYSHSEYMGMHASEIIAPESLELVLENIKTGAEAPYEAFAVTKSGVVFPVLITGKNISLNNKVVRVTSFRDITQEYRSRQQLEASENRFKKLSDLVTDGIIIHKNLRVVEVNLSFCKTLGYKRDELIGSNLLDYFPKAYHEAIQDRSNNTHRQIAEISILRKDGSKLPVEITTEAIEYEDGVYKAVSYRDISRQKEQEEKIRYQAQYDQLTKLPNRVLARDRIEHAINKSSVTGVPVYLLFIDLDDFKKVNDNLGHDVGDKLLVAAAKRFRSCINKEHTLSRHGGDEFLVLLEGIELASEAELIVESILQKFSNPFTIDGNELVVTTSIGLSVFPNDAEDYQSLMRTADIAMYQAKAEGRNTFHYYTQSMNDTAMRQLELDNQLRYALDRREFSLVYQPLYSGASDEIHICGTEVLLRWNSEQLGNVSPAEFIPLTEQTGLIIPIGRWVLEESCKQAQKWIESGIDDFSLSVNVSPRQFKGNDFLADLEYALKASGLNPQCLILEVTEGLLIQTNDAITKTIHAISAMGVRLSLDDFGTGYSSMSYLKNMPFDNLKIDRSFVQELPENKDSKVLVTASIAMAHELGLTVTAEGIETSQQLEYLQSKSCDYLQGFYLSRPISAGVFEQRLSEISQDNLGSYII